MKKLLLASSMLVLVSAPAFAGNINLSSVAQFGLANGAGVTQGGTSNFNAQRTVQIGVVNTAITGQGGSHNANISNTFQFGAANLSIVSQN